jgi:hypothetical protein
MKTKESGRYGPWEPMRGARRQAEAVQQESAVAGSRIKQTKAYKESVKNPSRVKPEQMRSSRVAARKGLTKGSHPNTPDR